MNLIRLFKQLKRESLEFHMKGQKEIARTNVIALMWAGSGLFLMTVIMFVVSMIMFPDWKPLWPHVGLLIIGLFSCIGGFILLKKEPSYYLLLLFAMLFQYGVIFMIIEMGTFIYWDTPSSFITLVLIVLPVMFIVPERLMLVSLFSWEVAFVILVYQTKVPINRDFDVFSSIAATLGSAILLLLISRLRVKEYLSKQEYKDLSVTDILTGVWNKTACEKEAEKYLSARGEEPFVFMVIDIDNFKEINDSRGHGVGDVVLKIAGDVLRDTFRQGDIFGRFGGDEFTILMPNVADKDLIEERILLFKNRFKKLVRLSIDYSATMSVGAVLIEEKKNKLSYGELFYMADSILYTVKSNGKGRHAIMTKGEFEQSSYRHKWMLIADGEETQRKILTNAFRDEYELIYAIDGEEAKKWITYYSDRLDVVIIDLNLPTISGQEIIRWMGSQEELGNVAIIATNNIQAKKANENDVGAPLFFKPFDLMYLKNKIDRLIVALSEKESIEWNQNM